MSDIILIEQSETQDDIKSESEQGIRQKGQSDAGRLSKKLKLNALETLYSFMRKYLNESKKKTGVSLPYTHSMTFEPYGAYDIPDHKYKTFLHLYTNAIASGYVPHITESHKDFGPIVIDLDFVQSKENSKRFYNENTIKNIIHTYNSIIRSFLKVTDRQFDAYVSEKANPVLRKGEYHDGIHIVYPFICTKPAVQALIRHKFIKEVRKLNLFKRIPHLNKLEDVVDEAVIYRCGWMLYGSRKNVSSQVYHVTHIYVTNSIYKVALEYRLSDVGILVQNRSDPENIRHFVDVLRCRRFDSEDQITPLADSVDPVIIDGKIKKLLNKTSTPGGEFSPTAKANAMKTVFADTINFIKVVPEETLVEAKNLVKLLSRERSYSKQTWMQVGYCLHNIDHRLLEDWVAFSKKAPEKFKQGECEALWKNMRPNKYRMASLDYFAVKDNPEQYAVLKKERIDDLLEAGLEASHRTIAKLAMEKYKYIYRCASIKHGIWYEFRNHKWIEVDSAYTLRNLISNEIVLEYANKQIALNQTAMNLNGYQQTQLREQANHIGKVIRTLNNTTFKTGVIRECSDIAYDPDFLKNLDENMYLICFENGVYDLEADIFRDGCPDDYLSLSVGYNYIELDENDQIAKDIDEFLSKIQPDKIMREYTMTLLSTCLAGSISEENFYVWTGSGANGKSKLMELLKYTLGDLFKPMDIRMLTEKRSSSSSASPELADKKGIRACPFDEPKAGDEINTGFMKIFTGGDMITARALFKEPIYFKPQFKPFLLCNQLPNIKSDDDGTWRRLKVIPFRSKFIKPTDADKLDGPDQFWADKTLSERLPEWKQTFMGMLIQYYRSYKKNGLAHPKLVTKCTDEYRKRCDIFQDFISFYLDKTDNAKDSISLSNMHEGMRHWYRNNYEGKCPNTKDLKAYLQQRISTFNEKTGILTGYRLKPEESEDDANDELNGNLKDV